MILDATTVKWKEDAKDCTYKQKNTYLIVEWRHPSEKDMKTFGIILPFSEWQSLTWNVLYIYIYIHIQYMYIRIYIYYDIQWYIYIHIVETNQKTRLLAKHSIWQSKTFLGWPPRSAKDPSHILLVPAILFPKTSPDSRTERTPNLRQKKGDHLRGEKWWKTRCEVCVKEGKPNFDICWWCIIIVLI